MDVFRFYLSLARAALRHPTEPDRAADQPSRPSYRVAFNISRAPNPARAATDTSRPSNRVAFDIGLGPNPQHSRSDAAAAAADRTIPNQPTEQPGRRPLKPIAKAVALALHLIALASLVFQHRAR